MYALALTALAAVIMGVLPGLRATGRRININLQEMNGRTGTRLGPMWTTLVVAQVAVAVAVLPVAFFLAWQVVQSGIAGPGFADEPFVVGAVALSDEPGSVNAARIQRRQLELMARVEAGVSAVTFSTYVPGLTAGGRIQFEDATIAHGDGGTLGVGTLAVAVEMLDVYGAQILGGRALTAGDLGAANGVVVNRAFEETFLPGRSAVGLRFRYTRRSGQAPTQQPGVDPLQQSYQIVGVVRDFPRVPPVLALDDTAVVYHPAAPGDVDPLTLSIRFNGDIPSGFTDRFRQIGAEVDPALQLRSVMPLSDFYYQLGSLWRYIAWSLGLVTTSVLLLSAAGIYALMSFTIAQRTREIGIRVALGAHPRRLLASIFGRVGRQLALGVLFGSLLSAIAFSSAGYPFTDGGPLLLAVATVMLIVGLLAAFGPARRSLRIQAMEALRADM